MVKCYKCNKIINKKTPGIQCGTCNKWIHATCASLTNDQLNVLVTTDSVDWKCKVCTGLKPKRLSGIMSDDEDVLENSTLLHNQTQEALRVIRQEVKEVIKQELQRTLEYYSDKIDEYESKMIIYEKNMKTLENQCTELRNNYKNLNLKYEVAESKINQMQQDQLCNQIELCGVEEKEGENITAIVKKIASAIHQNSEDVVKAYRKKYRGSGQKRGDVPTVIVSLKEGTRDCWLDACKKSDLSPTDLGLQGNKKIYMRASLTPATAFLLWKTKEELKGHCKFIWCKNGSILVRKNDKDKIMVVKMLQDLQKIKINYNKGTD